MKTIETRMDIAADTRDVWDVLMDFDSYATWNPMVVAMKGRPEIGGCLEITVAMQGGRRMRFRPTVVEHDPGRRFGWLGKLWVRGLFDGLHRFEVEPNGNGATFIHSEEFRGLLPIVVPKLLRDTHASIEAMNEALASEVIRRRARTVSLENEQRGPQYNAG